MSREQPRIGALRHRVTLEREVLTPGAAGSFARSWAQLGAAWAEIAPRKSAPAVESGRSLRRTRYQIRLRARPGLEHTDRICLGQRIFAVRGVVEGDATRRFLLFDCEEDRPQ